MRAIILAGGYAKRLWPLTERVAKPLLPVAGKPIIEHVYDRLDVTLDKIYISTNELHASQFAEWIATKKDARLELVIEQSRSEAEKLGTIGALAQIIENKAIADDLLIIAGDNLLTFTASEFIAGYKGNALVALCDLSDRAKAAGKYGVVEVRGDKVAGFQEKPEHPKTSLASTACYLYPKETLPLFAEYLSLGHSKDSPGFFLEWLHKKADVNPFIFTTGWYDIGDRDSYIKANQALGAHALGEVKHSKVTGSFVAENSIVTDSTIRDCVVLGGCEVTGCELHGCTVGPDTKLTGRTARDQLIVE